jgi:hypothetical protein
MQVLPMHVRRRREPSQQYLESKFTFAIGRYRRFEGFNSPYVQAERKRKVAAGHKVSPSQKLRFALFEKGRAALRVIRAVETGGGQRVAMVEAARARQLRRQTNGGGTGHAALSTSFGET